MRLRARHKAARLCHQYDERSLPHIGRLACHIRSGDQKQARIAVIQIGVVRHKQTVADHLLDDRVSALDDLQLHRSIHDWFHIAQLFTDLCKGGQDVELGDCCRGFLDCFNILLYVISDTEEEFIFQLIDLGLRVQHQIFHLFELRRDEAFRICQRLFSNVVFGNQIKIGFGYFQIIAEHAIIADL